jgi:hypothetical protein
MIESSSARFPKRMSSSQLREARRDPQLRPVRLRVSKYSLFVPHDIDQPMVMID